ncbi:MAG: 2-oxoacid:acceptor oxidoreductase family protein, partial [Rhodobiaceae bacterium]|nr:2-oxoacid:acceptor oxidoreductase family protein [Rhodobiaceae bacterium]
AIQPVETEFGRKRQIDQSACNKDFSCLKGFCPSFVTVRGGTLKKGQAVADDGFDLPEPDKPALDDIYSVVITGVGGTGVVTVGAILGMAAHLDGRGVGIIDMAGLAQKGGAVVSHLKIAPTPEEISTIRVAAGHADLVIGCDIVVAGSQKVLGTMATGRTRAVVNTEEFYPGAFTHDADYSLPSRRIIRAIETALGDKAAFVEATKLATALMGNSIAANMFMLGYAYQTGGIPLSLEAIERAIELNGTAVDGNKKAFAWGRRAAIEPDTVREIARPKEAALPWRDMAETLDDKIERRVAALTAYQSKRYANRYRKLVEKVRAAEAEKTPGLSGLAEAAASYLYKLMAYKDEYEVARLFTDGGFQHQLDRQFEGDYRLEFHLAPPMFAKTDPETGRLKKKVYGPGMMRWFRLLSRMKGLRGTPLDPFGRTSERRTERALVKDYSGDIDTVVAGLTPDTHAVAVGLLSVPEKIRGYGPVKVAHLDTARADREAFLKAFRDGGFQRAEAAE